MSQPTKTRALLAGCAAGLIAATTLAPDASAALITRQFEFQSTAGALQFGPTIGSFTYDDSVAPVGGGQVNQVGLFTDLSVSFGAFSFDENTANSGWLVFGAGGVLLDAHFGSNCFAGGCGLSGGVDGWWIRVGVPGQSVNDFTYSGYNGERDFPATNLNRLLDAGVPEPGALALLGLGLAGLGIGRRRR